MIDRRAAAAGALALPLAVRAQAAWPDRPVRIVVAFTAGGTTDIIARLMAQRLSEAWGQSVVVDNRPGAGGNVGTDHVAKSAPDGHTLLVGSVGPLAVNMTLFRTMPYDSRRDLAAVILLAGVPNLLVVHPGVPAASLAELIAHARERPGAISYASTGIGTSSHLAGVMLGQQAGIDIVHVPYRGAVALNDLLAGRVGMMFATIPSVIQHVREGRLRPLAVTSARRSRALPDIPTVAESGFAGFEASSWFGVMAPAGTPRPIIERINADCARILADPVVERTLIEQGADPVGGTPEAFAAYIAAEVDKWAAIVRAAGATAD